MSCAGKWIWKVGMILAGGGALLVISSCESVAPAGAGASSGELMRSADFATVGEAAGLMPAPSARAGAALAGRPEMARKPAPTRPGLGTTWGEYVSSPTSYTGFERAGSTPEQGVSAIWYNDKEGIDAMTGRHYDTTTGMQRAAGGLVEWGVKSGLGTLRNYHWDGKRFVAGRNGARYSVVVKNQARSRLEVVLSVDGLDVVDGREASTGKRGYIVWPGQTLEVKGWRSSEREVASFRFSSVANSYSALKHGSTRNVGVIGLAVFTEKGIDPWNGYSAETDRRFSASPFAEAPMQRAR